MDKGARPKHKKESKRCVGQEGKEKEMEKQQQQGSV